MEPDATENSSALSYVFALCYAVTWFPKHPFLIGTASGGVTISLGGEQGTTSLEPISRVYLGCCLDFQKRTLAECYHTVCRCKACHQSWAVMTGLRWSWWLIVELRSEARPTGMVHCWVFSSQTARLYCTHTNTFQVTAQVSIGQVVPILD